MPDSPRARAADDRLASRPVCFSRENGVGAQSFLRVTCPSSSRRAPRRRRKRARASRAPNDAPRRDATPHKADPRARLRRSVQRALGRWLRAARTLSGNARRRGGEL